MTRRSFGVEEELFLVDVATGRLSNVSDAVLKADFDRPVGEPPLERELFQSIVETKTEPQDELAVLLDDLVRRRKAAAEAAARAGAAVVAVGSPVLPDADPEVSRDDRYEQIADDFGPTGQRALVCGTHVHVSVDSDDEAVAVADRVRPWLPVLAALTSNSPFDHGRDTGFASWRTQVWQRWPSAGPVEPFGDMAGYRRTVQELISSGGALDEGMAYFDVRPATSFPTVELRVADACTDVRDTVLLAALSRALVDSVARDWREKTAPEVWRIELLRAARWRASHDGLSDQLLNPTTRRPAPAADVAASLVSRVGASLDSFGDRRFVTDGVSRLFAEGTGAQRQRAVAGREGNLGAVLEDLRHRTGSTG